MVLCHVSYQSLMKFKHPRAKFKSAHREMYNTMYISHLWLPWIERLGTFYPISTDHFGNHPLSYQDFKILTPESKTKLYYGLDKLSWARWGPMCQPLWLGRPVCYMFTLIRKYCNVYRIKYSVKSIHFQCFIWWEVMCRQRLVNIYTNYVIDISYTEQSFASWTITHSDNEFMIDNNTEVIMSITNIITITQWQLIFLFHLSVSPKRIGVVESIVNSKITL